MYYDQCKKNRRKEKQKEESEEDEEATKTETKQQGEGRKEGGSKERRQEVCLLKNATNTRDSLSLYAKRLQIPWTMDMSPESCKFHMQTRQD